VGVASPPLLPARGEEACRGGDGEELPAGRVVDDAPIGPGQGQGGHRGASVTMPGFSGLTAAMSSVSYSASAV
jgi:hypothetical protein